MPNRIFVAADERCGGSQLGNMFQVLGYNRVDDPQSHPVKDKKYYNVNYFVNNFNYFHKYDYIKSCMTAFKIEDYKKVVLEASKDEYKIILLWRRNFLERALSRAIAEATGTWHSSQKNKKYLGNFKIKESFLAKEIEKNRFMLSNIVKFLNDNNIEYFDLEFSSLYGDNLNVDQRYLYFKKVLSSIEPSLLDRLDDEKQNQIKEKLSPKERLNSKDAYQRITNIEKIISKYSNEKNGFVDLN